MSLFIKGGKIKSAFFLTAFSLSLAYLVVYIVFYVCSAGLVARFAPWETGGFWAKWLPPSIVSIVATIPCLVPMFFMQDKRLVPAAFLFLPAYTIIIVNIIVFRYFGAERSLFLGFILMYFGVPSFWGNVLAFGCYAKFFSESAGQHPRS